MRLLLLVIPFVFIQCLSESRPTDPAGSDTLSNSGPSWSLNIPAPPTVCVYGCMLCISDTIDTPACSLISAIDTSADSLPNFFVTGFTRGFYRPYPDSLLFYGFLNNNTSYSVKIDSCFIDFMLCFESRFTQAYAFDTIPPFSKHLFSIVHVPNVPDSMLYIYSKAAEPEISGSVASIVN